MTTMQVTTGSAPGLDTLYAYADALAEAQRLHDPYLIDRLDAAWMEALAEFTDSGRTFSDIDVATVAMWIIASEDAGII